LTASIALILAGFAYSLIASILAYRETGKVWMLFLPTWIDASCGVSTRVRRHGMLAFAVLFAGTVLLLS
jgi:hypothetical protein